MIVSIHQPQFFPWLGYFDKIRKAEIFVFLDDVQFKKNEWQNRNRIKTAEGPQWFTVPTTYHFPEKLNEVKINNQIDWRKSHLHSLKTNYSRSKFFDEVMNALMPIYEKSWEIISELNIATITECLKYLGIATKTVKSSEFSFAGASTERLVNICRHFKAEAYIAGQGGKEYMDESLFSKQGVKVEYQVFNHPVYEQNFGEFIPNMSIIDLLFNHGKKSAAILAG
jgi:hypothetical protein